ncbi:MAG: MATE family efflux transporter [Myxococcales bacterium]
MEPPIASASFERALSWERTPTQALAKLAWPITLSGLSFAVMSLVDTLFVARLGASMLAGVGLGAVITNGLMGFGFGVLRGLKVLLAQSRGSSSSEAVRAYVGGGLLLGFWLGLAALALGEFAAWVVPYFTASVEAGRAAREYIAVRSLGAPIIVVYVALREGRYGLGDTRSPLISSLVSNLLHAGLDYVALFVLGWGAAGAALANVLAFSLQTGLLAHAQGRGAFTFGEAEFKAQFAVLRAGAFTGLQWALEIGALAFLALLLSGLGDLPMAAHQLAVQLVIFSFLPALAIAESASILAGEAVGRGRTAAVHGVAKAARRVALGYASLCALVFVLGGRSLAAFMTQDQALRETALPVFWAAATYLLLESVTVAGNGVLRGVGAQRFSALCALGCAWLCTPVLGYLFTRVLSVGAAGGFLARACEMALAGTLVWRHVDRNAWLEVAERSRRSVLRQAGAKA